MTKSTNPATIFTAEVVRNIPLVGLKVGLGLGLGLGHTLSVSSGKGFSQTGRTSTLQEFHSAYAAIESGLVEL